MIERIKTINRALLELWIGILFLGIVCQLVGMWFVGEKLFYTFSLWIGIVLAMWMVWHMYHSLDKVLDMGAGAQKAATTNNMLRYLGVIIVFVIVTQIEGLNPLIVFMGLMSVKVAAYLQPFTHKVCNKLFHEEDPVPEPMPEEPSTEVE